MIVSTPTEPPSSAVIGQRAPACGLDHALLHHCSTRADIAVRRLHSSQRKHSFQGTTISRQEPDNSRTKLTILASSSKITTGMWKPPSMRKFLSHIFSYPRLNMPPRKHSAAAGVTKKYRGSQSLAGRNAYRSRGSFYNSSNNSVVPQGQQNLSKLFDKYRGMTDFMGSSNSTKLCR